MPEMPDVIESGKSSLAGGLKKAVSLRPKLPKILSSKQASTTASLRFCYHCGAVLSAEFEPGTKCPACKRSVEAVAATPPGLTKDGRVKLEKEIVRWIDKGYRIVRQKGDFVELRKPKRFSEKWAAAWLIAGIPFPGAAIAYAGGYAVWHVVRKERSVMLFLSADGTVRTEKNTG